VRPVSDVSQQTPVLTVTPALRAVPPVGTTAFAAFVAELNEDEDPNQSDDLSIADLETLLDDEALLELGYPVAVLAGDHMPDCVDESADCHRAAVINIEAARLRRYLREMEPVRSIVVRLTYGIGCDHAYTQREVAAHTGLSQASVCRVLDLAMAELRRRFGVRDPEIA